MPDKQKTRRYGSQTLKFDPREGMYYRHGYLGQKEYLIPDGEDPLAGRGQGRAMTDMVRGTPVYYMPDSFNNEKIRRHEAVHVAQARQKNPPPYGAVMEALEPSLRTPQVKQDEKYWRGGDGKSGERWTLAEAPAYGLTEHTGPEAQQAYDNYLGLLQEHNPDTAFNLEVAVRPEMAKSNLKRIPPRYTARPPKIEMKEVPLE